MTIVTDNTVDEALDETLSRAPGVATAAIAITALDEVLIDQKAARDLMTKDLTMLTDNLINSPPHTDKLTNAQPTVDESATTA